MGRIILTRAGAPSYAPRHRAPGRSMAEAASRFIVGLVLGIVIVFAIFGFAALVVFLVAVVFFGS
jgi:tetrahydromethanopterin S-methyltransferase subunit B